jgi:multidrug efflux system membrane fusion protein
LSLLALPGCSDNTAARSTPPPLPVQIAVAETLTLPRTLELIGTVQPLRTVAVKSQVDGVIATVHFREGDEVKPGDLLVTLDRRPFENALRIARAELANAQAEATRAAADAERYANLDQQAAVSKEQLSELSPAPRPPSRSSPPARPPSPTPSSSSATRDPRPLGGRTGELRLHEGALVKANDSATALVTINQLDPIAVAFAVPESSLDAVRAASAAGTAPSPSATAAAIRHPSPARSPSSTTPSTPPPAHPAQAQLPNAPACSGPAASPMSPSSSAPTPASSSRRRRTAGPDRPAVFVVQPDKTVALRRSSSPAPPAPGRCSPAA